MSSRVRGSGAGSQRGTAAADVRQTDMHRIDIDYAERCLTAAVSLGAKATQARAKETFALDLDFHTWSPVRRAATQHDFPPCLTGSHRHEMKSRAPGRPRRRVRFSRQWSSSAPPAGSSIGTRSPRLFLRAAQKPHKRCTTSCLRPTLSYAFAHPPHRPFRPQRVFGARACGAVARLTPWIGSGIGSAVRATDRSLRLARSSPDPHPPRSRMRCDGLVRSARSRLISRACSSASGFCARRPGCTLHRPQRLPAGDGASACLCLRVVSDARKQPAQSAGPRRAVPSRRSWRQPLLLDRDLSNNSRLPSFCE